MGREILLLTAYFEHSVGFRSDTNANFDARRVFSHGRWEVVSIHSGCGLQLSAKPMARSDSTWRWHLDQATGCIGVIPEGPSHTCRTGKGQKPDIIDYFMVSACIRPLIQRCEVIKSVPWGPHYGVKLVLNIDFESVLSRQLVGKISRRSHYKLGATLEGSDADLLEEADPALWSPGLGPGLVWSGLVWSGLVWSGLGPGLVWSGLVWSGLVWSGSGLVWSGLVWSGLVWSGLVWSGLVWSGLVWSGLVWSGLVWSGLVWSGLVWSGLVWSGLVWSGLVWSGLVWCGVVCGVVWCGVVWCGVVWCGVVWCGVVWCGVVWCGVVWCARTQAEKQLPEPQVVPDVAAARTSELKKCSQAWDLTKADV